MRSQLVNEVQALISRKRLAKNSLARLRVTNGYRNQIADMLALTSLLQVRWPAIERVTGLKLADIHRAEGLTNELTMALGVRAQGTAAPSADQQAPGRPHPRYPACDASRRRRPALGDAPANPLVNAATGETMDESILAVELLMRLIGLPESAPEVESLVERAAARDVTLVGSTRDSASNHTEDLPFLGGAGGEARATTFAVLRAQR